MLNVFNSLCISSLSNISELLDRISSEKKSSNPCPSLGLDHSTGR
ncbi:hypothetical protein LOK49_Contig688G00001 [Camellia lanceoleosa]|nr:hypothetical protein LOK49_Contig688G00001 [Camellia lanceoleosa]